MRGRSKRGSGGVAGVAERRSIMVNRLVCESNETCWSAARGPVGHRGALDREESGTPPSQDIKHQASNAGLHLSARRGEVRWRRRCCIGRSRLTASRRLSPFSIHHVFIRGSPSLPGPLHTCPRSSVCTTASPPFPLET